MTHACRVRTALLLSACAAHVGVAQSPESSERRSVVILVQDATGRPVDRARVQGSGQDAMTGGDGSARLNLLAGDTVRVRRVGFGARNLVTFAADTLLVLLLRPLQIMPETRTESRGEPAARLTSYRSVAETRASAQPTLAALVASMPGVSSRSAHGETTWQLRGARAEQVLVTLDGVPLNDPATGTADAADLPLALLEGVRLTPGADGGAGSGAVGGTLALTTARAPVLSVTTGAFGAWGIEGAGTLDAGGVRVRAGAAWREARNDFPFVNSDGTAGADSIERRSNNDERRLALFASITAGDAWATAFASRTARGLAGAMNVRSAEGDRAFTDRAVVRAGAGRGNWTLAGGVRTLHMRFANLRAPTLDTDARTLSPDVEMGVSVLGVAWRAGMGVDRLEATALVDASRMRGWASAERAFTAFGWQGSAGVRVDAFEGAGTLASPWLSIERAGRVTPFARLAQAFRAPTLYDLYLAAPQRLAARPLRPERTTLDAEVGLRARFAQGALAATVSAYTRTVDDAIIWFPGNFTWSPSNVGREQAVGAEASLAFTFERGGVTTWGGASRAELDADGFVVPTPYVPQVAGGISMHVAAGPGTWTATAHATGARAFTAAPASAATQLPAVGLLDLAWSRTFSAAGAPMLAAFGVTNLFDARYESVRRFPSVGRAWTLSLTLSP